MKSPKLKAAFTCCVFILKSFLFSRCSLGVMLICHISSGFRASAEDTIKRTGLQSCSSLKMKQMLLQKCKMWANLAFQYLQCSLCITNISPVLQGRRCSIRFNYVECKVNYYFTWTKQQDFQILTFVYKYVQCFHYVKLVRLTNWVV